MQIEKPVDFKRKRLIGTNAEYLLPLVGSPTVTNK